MHTSNQGIAFLERHEGVVLRAYRCPAGIWTIGAGLTAASGVIKPVAGMVITRTEAARLLSQALQRNYEPAVNKAMPGADQREFDAGVSFHFNTGAIGRASWVRKWNNGDWPGVKVALAMWNKGGGKVLPGLTRRRAEEYALLYDGNYGAGIAVETTPATVLARYVAPITTAEMPAIRDALRQLGYTIADLPGIGIEAQVVRAFQRDHGLTEDGIIGRATATTLQRVLDARAKAPAPAAVAAVGGAEVAGSDFDMLAGIPWLGEAAIGLAAARGLYLAWTYRDTIAPVFDRHLPRLAALLRSF